MSTRSFIGILNPTGSVEYIRCHFDGYPDHHIPILTNFYKTEEAVRSLIFLGDLSSLDEEIGEKHDFDARPHGQCNYYGRDRGDVETEPMTASSESMFDRLANEYAYLFKNSEWWWRSRDGDWTIAKKIT